METVSNALALTLATIPEHEAPARARAWFPIPACETPTTTTTEPARYFLTTHSETPWPERSPNS
eukprot:4261993-Pyramimonas_sp.AAC.1